MSSGTSFLIVASCLDSSALSCPASTFCLSAPFSSWAWSRRFSTWWYSDSSFSAVFSPTPGMPGMLSELSPIRPFRSRIWSGTMPMVSASFCSSMISMSVMPFFMSRTCVVLSISCSRSWSLVRMLVAYSGDLAAIVPIRSSASVSAISSQRIW